MRTLFRIVFLFFVCLASIYADTSVNRHHHPLPLIVDTDCDLDDMMAIVYLAQNPRVEVKGITTVGDGVSHWEYGAQNILNVLELVGHPRVPVALGARESLSPVASYPLNWRKQANEVSGIQLPHSSYHPVGEKGAEFIIQKLLQSHEPMTLLCIGPLTNIAIALEKKPEIKSKIKRLYLLGGALLSPGNLEGRPLGFKNRVAEYNIFLDAKAAHDVLEAEIPITLIPLDIVEHIPSKPFYEMISNDRQTPAANFVYEVLKPSLEHKKRARESLWDPVAAALVTNPELANYRELKIVVNLRRGPDYGRLIMSNKGAPVQVVTQVNTKAFYDLFLDVLNRNPNLHASHTKTR